MSNKIFTLSVLIDGYALGERFTLDVDASKTIAEFRNMLSAAVPKHSKCKELSRHEPTTFTLWKAVFSDFDNYPNGDGLDEAKAHLHDMNNTRALGLQETIGDAFGADYHDPPGGGLLFVIAVFDI
ncbi:hypothetical protein BGZ95_006715 [Linnemannia exigua]|uniref:Uncharacterized protein n=1 Tax=Linnemannia exigua TaxID=604196 RepID=A0AAD4D144_9FUNG|nr:hypothetical protein BGZ95_006715 [Linnemannia exigua]